MLFAKTIKVHEGFLEAYNTVSVTVRLLLEKLSREYPRYNVSMTGHSLGGGTQQHVQMKCGTLTLLNLQIALASLAALDTVQPTGILTGYSLKNASQVRVYTMGAPRIGNRYFADLFDNVGFGEVIRAVNFSDPIPHLVSVLVAKKRSSHVSHTQAPAIHGVPSL